MDYYGIPKVKSYLGKPFVFAVDVANNIAAIPGSGDMPIVFTHISDVARFIAAFVGSSDWPERTTIIGDKKTWNEFVAIAEEVKGSFAPTHPSNDMSIVQGQCLCVPQASSSTSHTTTRTS